MLGLLRTHNYSSELLSFSLLAGIEKASEFIN